MTTQNERVCTTCGQPLTWIKPGVSKRTGRKYNGFWACPDSHKQAPQPQQVSEYDNDYSPWSQGNQGGGEEDLDTWSPAPKREPVKDEVWQAKDLRIARESALGSISRVISAEIQAGLLKDDTDIVATMIDRADKLVKFIYEGNTSEG